MKTITIHRLDIPLVVCCLIGLAAILWPPSSAAAAGPWYVAPGGSNVSDCLSPATACATINGAIAKATTGDTILVAVGTYKGSGSEVVLVNKDITISGGWNPGFTSQTGVSTLDGEGARRGIYTNPLIIAVLEHFIVQNGYAVGSAGGGIYNNGNLTLNHFSIRWNTAGTDGKGVFNFGVLTLNNTSVIDNAGGIANGGSWSSSPVSMILNNSTVSGNAASGIENASSGSLLLNSSTVSENGLVGSWYTQGIRNSAGGNVTLQNSILSGNLGNPSDCVGTIGSAGYNLIGSTSGCTFVAAPGDLTNVDAKLGELISLPAYHPLLSDSPAVDAGNPAGCPDQLGDPLLTDQRGASRVGQCDIGAYEYTVPGPAARIYAASGTPQHAPPGRGFLDPLVVHVMDAIGSPVSGTLVTFTGPSSGPTLSFSDSGTNATSATSDVSGVVVSASLTANDQRGSYTVTASAAGVAQSGSFELANVMWFVAPGGNDANSCAAPGEACATINSAVGRAYPGDGIAVASGIYTGTGTEVVRILKHLTLLGGWDPAFSEETGISTIDGQGSRGGVVSGAIVTVERFTIRNGCCSGGAGIRMSGELNLNWSTVTGNYGSGIEAQLGTLVLNNSTVSGNTVSSYGAGIYAYDSLVVLNNSTISGNSVASEYGSGGGIYVGGNAGNAIINSSTITGNTAGGGGGILADKGTIRNSIVAGNNGAYYPDCSGLGMTSAGYNLFGIGSGCPQHPTDMVGTASDPLNPLLGPLQGNGGPTFTHALQAGSPAIDTANPSGCTDQNGDLLTTDQRGEPRPWGAACDIGAYESQQELSRLFMPCVLRSYCQPLYHDDFSDPGSGWPVADTGDVTYEYLAGEYRILVKSNYWWAGATPGFAATDYVVEVNVRNATPSDGSYGLLFGLSNDWEEFYEFDINQGGYYALYRFDSGAWTELASGSSAAIHTGTATNRLKILREGTTIQAYANGTLLATVADGSFTGVRRLGLIAFSNNDTNMDARFDTFAVYPVTCTGSGDLAQGGLLPTEGIVVNGGLKPWAGGPDSRR